jgi:hypothetical protein
MQADARDSTEITRSYHPRSSFHYSTAPRFPTFSAADECRSDSGIRVIIMKGLGEQQQRTVAARRERALPTIHCITTIQAQRKP